MTKRDYFLLCVQNTVYRYKTWLYHVFTVTKNDGNYDIDYLPYKGEKHYYFINPETKESVDIIDSDVNRPLFNFREPLKLNAGDYPNLKEDITTNYGIALANAVVLVYPFNDKIDFINGQMNVGDIESQIAARLTTDKEYQKPKELKRPDPIYVSEYLNYIDAITSLDGLSQLVVPSATEKSLMTSPEVIKRRDELLEQYKDQLNDPAVVSKIEAELIALDKEWIKGDLSEGFYHKSKSFDIIRKKVHIMQGYEGGFGYNPTTITASLDEGWNRESLPANINALREGVYGRGKMTGLGGYATKTTARVFQNITIEEEDCGTTLGWDKEVTESNKKTFLGFYIVDGKSSTLLTKENIAKYVGKTVVLRSPQFCKTPDNKFCKHCMGQPNSELETGTGALATDITSAIMYHAMGAAHAVALKTAAYDPKITIV